MASLTDIRVGGPKKYGPDDALYNRHADLRARVARGNTVMYFVDKESGDEVGLLAASPQRPRHARFSPARLPSTTT